MNLIALILGLALERLLTRLLHLRELHWLDDWFDRGAAWIRAAPAGLAWLVGLCVMLLPVVPVAWVAWAFGDLLYGLAYLAFAALVLFFSLGPQDLLAQLKLWLDAQAQGDMATAAAVARSIQEPDGERPPVEPARPLECAVFVQANHRIFGVVFWFMLLGPAGAWAYRVADLFRRRLRASGGGEQSTRAVEALFGLLAWVPARLLALSYAVAGSFDDAVQDWRDYYRQTSAGFFHVSEDILAAAGIGAIRRRRPASDALAAMQAARQLVLRALTVWVTVIALLTLAGWAA